MEERRTAVLGDLRPLRHRQDGVKFSANKYVLSATNGIAAALNPMRLQSSSLSWTDMNNDDIAQGARGCAYLTPGCEMNFSQLASNFGLITPGCTTIYSPGSIACGTDQADPNIKRDTEIAYGFGVQHEVLPGSPSMPATITPASTTCARPTTGCVPSRTTRRWTSSARSTAR